MLKRFYLMFFGAVLFILPLSGCAQGIPSIPGVNAPVPQPLQVPCLTLTYNFSVQPPSPQQALLEKAGNTISVTWKFSATSPAKNTAITPIQHGSLQETLLGPFLSVAAIQAAMRQAISTPLHRLTGPVAANATPIIISGCAAKSYTSSITIPRGLKPGFYALDANGDYNYASGSNGLGGNVFIQIKG